MKLILYGWCSNELLRVNLARNVQFENRILGGKKKSQYNQNAIEMKMAVNIFFETTCFIAERALGFSQWSLILDEM